MALFNRGRTPQKVKPEIKQHHRGEAIKEDMAAYKNLYWP